MSKRDLVEGAGREADDPRGGFQSEEYRRADPRDLVVEGSTAMSGPGGAPQKREPVAREAERPDGER